MPSSIILLAIVNLDADTALILRALELEHPLLGRLNRQLVELGARPLAPREPWLSQAKQERG